MTLPRARFFISIISTASRSLGPCLADDYGCYNSFKLAPIRSKFPFREVYTMWFWILVTVGVFLLTIVAYYTGWHKGWNYGFREGWRKETETAEKNRQLQ